MPLLRWLHNTTLLCVGLLRYFIGRYIKEIFKLQLDNARIRFGCTEVKIHFSSMQVFYIIVHALTNLHRVYPASSGGWCRVVLVK